MKNILIVIITTLSAGFAGAISAPASSNDINVIDFEITTAKIKKTDDFEKLIRDSFELYKKGSLSAALAGAEKAKRLNQKDFRPYLLAGLVHRDWRELKVASENFARAIELKPGDKQLYMLKAWSDYLRNAREGAIAACRAALKIDPSLFQANIMIGDILHFDETRWDQAIVAYNAALESNPRAEEAYEGLGRIYRAKKDFKSSEEILRKGMNADPNGMMGRFELGRLLVKQGRIREARKLWDGRKSDTDRTFPNFITLLERAEKLQSAKAILVKRPNDPKALLQMGIAVMNGDSWVVDGRQKKAIVYFQKALAIDPNFAKAQSAIVKAYIQIADTYTKENGKVDEELAKLKRLDPKLATDMENYRRTFSGGLTVAAPKKQQ